MADPIIEQRTDGTTIADVGLSTRVVVPAGGPLAPSEDRNDPGYPDVIVDQRTGYAAPDATQATDVQGLWDAFLAKQGLVVVPTADEVIPYINHSRWCADCTCGGGMLCWDRNPYACCLDCGRRYKVVWQDPQLRSAVIRELAAREPQHRNWDPRRADKEGNMVETLAFLQRENLLMGVDGGVHN